MVLVSALDMCKFSNFSDGNCPVVHFYRCIVSLTETYPLVVLLLTRLFIVIFFSCNAAVQISIS